MEAIYLLFYKRILTNRSLPVRDLRGYNIPLVLGNSY